MVDTKIGPVKTPVDLTPTEFRQWLDALRSGQYEQGHYVLKNYPTDTEHPVYCCLGVLREVCPSVQKVCGDAAEFLMDRLVDAHGEDRYVVIPKETQFYLGKMNDGHAGETLIERLDFDQIAGWIEANLEPKVQDGTPF